MAEKENGNNGNPKLRRVGTAGTFEWIYEYHPEVRDALFKMNNAIAKSRQGNVEYVSEIARTFAIYVDKFGEALVKAYTARDKRAGRNPNSTVKVDV